MSTLRHTRYQAAIIRDNAVLLIRIIWPDTGHTYWCIPGGGMEEGESEEECVVRESHEETGLDVRVERLLLEQEGAPGGMYRKLKTYQCTVLAGEPVPGYEPEVNLIAQPDIVETKWFDLSDPPSWDALAIADHFTYPLLLELQAILLR